MDEVKAYMEKMGFQWQPYGKGLWFHNDTESLTPVQAEFMYNAHIASTRKTLEIVRQDVVGRDETNEEANGLLPDRADRRNQLRAEQRQKLDQMISALERKGEEE